MIPRFLRTFLIISTLIILTTLYVFYPLHTKYQWSSASSTTDEDGVSAREDHWDKGGLEPSFKEEQRLVEWNNEDDRGLRSGEDAMATPHAQTTGRVSLNNQAVDSGGVIMSRLGNATAKAELGRAAWKVLHTMTLRFPEKPTEDERSALKSYMHLFSRLYPCGECAEEFQALLKEYPPQTSSRKAASVWLCSIHNMVNARLGKDEFDCNALEGTYDCGCGGEEGDEGEAESKTTARLKEVKDSARGEVDARADLVAAKEAGTVRTTVISSEKVITTTSPSFGEP